MMTPLTIAFLMVLTAPVAPIRIYSGTIIPTEDSYAEASKEISKRSWDTATAGPDTASQPGLYKVKLTQVGYIQFLRYMTDVPPLQQYTFCIWLKSKNFTHNHPILSYSLNERDSLIRVWLDPSESTLKATLKGEPFFRVPVNFREGRWTHICQSWSGATGEWVVFLDGKLRARDIVSRHIGTFLQGGGDIAVGQDLPDFNKGLDDGVEGEIFGFNFVDEAVEQQDIGRISDQGAFSSDEIHQSSIPGFKKLPATKKTFDDIQGFLSKLPDGSPTLGGTRIGEEPAPLRTKQRVRNKAPVRKVVVYREDRMHDSQQMQKRVGEDIINFIPAAPRGRKVNQVYDINYNMHAYKYAKKSGKPTYKIFEEPEDETDRYFDDQATFGSETKLTSVGRRRARHNFDVFSLREANRMNPFYMRPYETHRTKYHFERDQPASRRSITLDEPEIGVTKRSPRERTNLPDIIPVHEEFNEEGFRRRKRRETVDESKRDARHITSGIHSNGFRPLPELPEGFANLFNQPVPKEEIFSKINLYIDNNGTKEPVLPALHDPLNQNEVLKRRDPQNFPTGDDLLIQAIRLPNIEDHNAEPSETTEQRDSERRNSGSELVSRSYAICASGRGSPISDKRHILVSWADTPVRIYGGAMVITANSICGHF